jgi:chromosome partitioning protein
MAVVITVAQQKGGAGKTMLAANLSVAFAAQRRVALLDIDPQRSLARWHAIRLARPSPAAAIAFSDVSGWRLPGELDRLRRDWDVLVVDTPPQIDSDSRRAVRSADLVLIPVQASAPDLWAAEGTVALARSEKRQVAIVLNRAPTARLQRERALGDVRLAGHTPLVASLGNRAAFAQAFAAGLGVMEAAPRTVAAAEMLALFKLIEEMLP